MSGALTTSGFVVFFLLASGIQAQDGWGVTYTSEICALKGSTVYIPCSYRYPSRGNDGDTTVKRILWFIKMQDKDPVDLRTDPEYAGRVQYIYHHGACGLNLTDLRESDSAVYRFRFMTSQPDQSFTDEPGVRLSVTGFQVQVSGTICAYCSWKDLKCHSSCQLPVHSSYIWYKNGQKMHQEQESFSSKFYSEDSVSCALKEHFSFASPSVCVRDQSCYRVTYTDRSICAFKGSSVDISCTYNTYYSYQYITSKFWFSPERSQRWQYNSHPEDFHKDSEYRARFQVIDTHHGRSTLRITELRGSDSANYHFKFKTSYFEWQSSLPGTTLKVTDPDLQVQVIWSSTGPKLVCHSSCLPAGRSSFVWYKNGKTVEGETSLSYRGHVDPAASYYCAYEGYHSTPVYAPKVPLVLMSSRGDIMENSSVNLTCYSDANPAAKYTWNKEKQILPNKGPQLVFRSIRSSDSGQYYCTAENELGRKSFNVFVNVKYAPKLPSVSVSPSGEIVEGSSVTLTCSSDANPAAKYTWYKENQPLLHGPEGVYHFTSISSEDRGIYYCKSENQHGWMNSTSLILDVQYAPKLPSVSVSPSGEIKEGSSVNLTCSSDANPAAKYTWYKENEESPEASGQMFTITDIRAEHSGIYYCEAQNRRGRHNSTFHLTVVAGVWKSAATGTITAVLLVVILLAVFLSIRRKKSTTQQSDSGERPDNREQAAEECDGLHYSSIYFAEKQEEDALYSNIRPAQPHRHTDEEEEEDVVDYATVKADGTSSPPRIRVEENGEDSYALYSTVNKSAPR